MRTEYISDGPCPEIHVTTSTAEDEVVGAEVVALRSDEFVAENNTELMVA